MTISRKELEVRRVILIKRFMDQTLCDAAGLYRGAVHEGEGFVRVYSLQMIGEKSIVEDLQYYEGSPFVMNFELDDQSSLNKFGSQDFDKMSDPMKNFASKNKIISAIAMSISLGGHAIGWFGGYRLRKDANTKAIDSKIASLSNEYIKFIENLENLEKDASCPKRAFILFSNETLEIKWLSSYAAVWLEQSSAIQDLNSIVKNFCLSDNETKWDWLPGAALRLTRGATALNQSSSDSVMVELVPISKYKTPPIATLTQTQQKIARLFAEGATDQQIAEHMSRSVETIRTHRKNIYKQLDIGCRAELVSLVKKIWI